MRSVIHILLLTLAVLMASTGLTNAQDFSSITRAMEAGNAKELARQFDGTVEVTVVSSEASHSKSQAEVVVRQFFSSNPVRSFSQVHTGSSDMGAKYQIGNLVTASGTFRTYVFIRQRSGAWYIQEVRFERD